MSDTYTSHQEIAFDVYDLTGIEDESFKAGFYYNIPGDTSRRMPGEIPLVGPFDEKQDACDAAVSIVEQLLAEAAASDQEPQLPAGGETKGTDSPKDLALAKGAGEV